MQVEEGATVGIQSHKKREPWSKLGDMPSFKQQMKEPAKEPAETLPGEMLAELSSKSQARRGFQEE